MLTRDIFDTSMALTGDAATDPNIAASGSYIATLIVSNDSAASVTVAVNCPLPVGAASVATTATDSGDVTGTASGFSATGVIAISDTVVLPAHTEVTYVITVTVSAGLGTSTQIAYMQVVGEANRRLESSNPVAIGAAVLVHDIYDRNIFQMMQAMHAFFGVSEGDNVQYMLDRMENAGNPFTFPDMLREVDEAVVANAAAFAAITVLTDDFETRIALNDAK